jgi:hypothetical protein
MRAQEGGVSKRFVYFMEATTASDIRAVKIGVANNPRGRVRDLQCGSPTKIKLLAFVRGDERLERKLHLTFESIALHGEWFARVGKLDFLLNYVEGYAEENAAGGEVTAEQFEVAIGDNVVGQSWIPVCSWTEEDHEASADASLWADY